MAHQRCEGDGGAGLAEADRRRIAEARVCRVVVPAWIDRPRVVAAILAAVPPGEVLITGTASGLVRACWSALGAQPETDARTIEDIARWAPQRRRLAVYDTASFAFRQACLDVLRGIDADGGLHDCLRHGFGLHYDGWRRLGFHIADPETRKHHVRAVAENAPVEPVPDRHGVAMARVPTLGGDLVRSGGEARIANALFELGLRTLARPDDPSSRVETLYEYERTVFIDRVALRPDFTLHAEGGPVFIEYLGLWDAADRPLRERYRADWEFKRPLLEKAGTLVTLRPDDVRDRRALRARLAALADQHGLSWAPLGPEHARALADAIAVTATATRSQMARLLRSTADYLGSDGRDARAERDAATAALAELAAQGRALPPRGSSRAADTAHAELDQRRTAPAIRAAACAFLLGLEEAGFRPATARVADVDLEAFRPKPYACAVVVDAENLTRADLALLRRLRAGRTVFVGADDGAIVSYRPTHGRFADLAPGTPLLTPAPGLAAQRLGAALSTEGPPPAGLELAVVAVDPPVLSAFAHTDYCDHVAQELRALVREALKARPRETILVVSRRRWLGTANFADLMGRIAAEVTPPHGEPPVLWATAHRAVFNGLSADHVVLADYMSTAWPASPEIDALGPLGRPHSAHVAADTRLCAQLFTLARHRVTVLVRDDAVPQVPLRLAVAARQAVNAKHEAPSRALATLDDGP